MIEHCISLVLKEKERLGSFQAVSKRVGVSRSAISTFARRCYPGNAEILAAKVMNALEEIECPFLSKRLSHDECSDFATRPLPTNSALALRHWRACRQCQHSHRDT